MKLVIRCQVGDQSSYAFHANIIIRGLQRLGYELCIIPYNQCAWIRRLPAWIDDYLHRQPVFDAPQLIIHPPKQCSDDPDKTIYSTMWETTRIDPAHIHGLNDSRALIVPSEQNIMTFSAQGVHRPMHKVPFGIDTDVFTPRPFVERDHVVFGTSGISRHGWPRKGFDEVVEAFKKAFPDPDAPVELLIKCYPKDPVPYFEDKRIRLAQGEWPKEKLAEWYAEIDCYVCMSKGEGWGLMPHEAMAVGRPSVIPIWFGIADYCDATTSFPVSYDLVPATHFYEDRGLWVDPSVDDCAQIMRTIAGDKAVLLERSRLGAERARQYTYERMARGYAGIIDRYFGDNGYL